MGPQANVSSDLPRSHLSFGRGVWGGSGLAAFWSLIALQVGGVAAGAGEPPPVPLAVLTMRIENPLARAVSFQLNQNVNFRKGLDERTQSVTGIGATYPFDLPRDWNLFINTTLPIISQPVGAADRTFGLGDMSLTAFVSPPSSPHWVFGAGPAMIIPTATDRTLGQGKWDFGPAIAVVHTTRTWVAGVVFVQSWSIAGANSRPEVSRLVISPFTTYYINKGWYLFSAPSLSSDWTAKGSGDWTIPLGGGLGHIVRKGKHAVNFAVQGYTNIERPVGAPTWQFRFTCGWVFPK